MCPPPMIAHGIREGQLDAAGIIGGWGLGVPSQAVILQKRLGVDPVWWTVFLRCFLHGMHQLELERAAVVERRVATLGIVEAVNVLAN